MVSVVERVGRPRLPDDALSREAWFSPEEVVKWRTEFLKATKGSERMTLAQFMDSMSCRSRFYSVKLFDAIDTNGDGAICFLEYSRFMQLLAGGSSEELATFAFNLFDSKRNGYITGRDLKVALEASVQESRSEMTKADAEEHLSVLIRLFTDGESELITKERFVSVLKTYPDVLGNFTVGDGARAASLYQPSMILKRPQNRWEKTRRWIQNNPRRTLTYTVTTLIIILCLAWRFLRFSGDCSNVDLNFRDPDLGVTRQEVKDKVQDVFGVHMSRSDAQYMVFSEAMMETDPMECRDARKRRLLTWTLPIGKACGQGLKPVLLLILFPVSRTLMTNLRKTFLKGMFDFDNAIAYHRFLGKVGFWLSWIHSLAQFWHVYRWQDGDNFKQWSFAFPDDKSGASFDLDSVTNETALYRGIPMELLNNPSQQPSAFQAVSSCASVTGIVLLVIYSVAALFAFDYPKNMAIFTVAPGEYEAKMSRSRRLVVRLGKWLNDFNNFWYTHHLFAFFYVALLLHPMPDLPGERREWGYSDTWLWVMVPALIYLLERIARATQSSSQTPVIGLRLLPGRVVELKVKKPEGLKYKSGQYVFINIQQIAPFEWHPFTLTSAPHEPHLSAHIRVAGDWTNALHTSVSKYKSYSESEMEIAITVDTAYPFNVRIAGPYGAPAQNYRDYPVIVCIGAGIGVTPFASILNTVLNTPPREGNKKVEKVYFHWAVRTRKEASWFKTLIDEIAAKDTDGILNISIHITSLKEGSDLRVMLLRLAEFENVDTQTDVVGRSVIQFGHPDWSKILHAIHKKHENQSKIGVFYCGPSGLKTILKHECARMGPRFHFRKEVF